MSSGWYRDNLGNHTIIICKSCFTIHDVIGTLNVIAFFSGGASFKIVNALTPQNINKALSEVATDLEKSDLALGVPKSMSEIYYGMPITILKQKFGMSDVVVNFLVENGIINDPIERI